MKYPLKFMMLSTKLHWRMVVISLPWLIGTFWTVTSLLGWSSYQLEFQYRSRCNIDLKSQSVVPVTYVWMLTVFNFALPIFVFMFCFVKVRAILRDMSRLAEASNGEDSTIAKVTRKCMKMQTVLVFVMVINFLIAWSPYAVIVILQITIRTVPADLYEVAAIFAKTSMFSNPICYGFIYKNIRGVARGLFRCNKVRQVQVTPLREETM